MKDAPIQFERLKLRNWLKLSDIYEKLLSAVDINEIVDLIDTYISIALEGFNIDEKTWMETVEVINNISSVNKPSLKLPSLLSNKKHKSPSWDYDRRTWYLWLHVFAKEYGWDSEYVAELDVDDALGLMQEVLVDDQLSKEWEWQLSELAYPYDKSTKKSKFSPLTRPAWMASKPQEIPVIKINKRFVPVGNVIRHDDHVKH